LFDWFPLDFAGRALPTDTREGCKGFWGVLLSLEDYWQQDHYGCNQGGSNKSGDLYQLVLRSWFANWFAIPSHLLTT
jgi:hypothetical protein